MKISEISSQISRFQRDIYIILCLSFIAMFLSLYSSHLLDPAVIRRDSQSSYFEADVARVYNNMADRYSNHYRTKVHPLFSLIAATPVLIAKKALRIPPYYSIKIYIAVIASFWIISIYIFLRLIGCQKFDAFLLSLLSIISSASIFFLAVPETYSFGSLSIILSFIILRLSDFRNLSHWWFTGTSALTLSFTITNWMAGIFVTFSNFKMKRAAQITVNAFVIVILLWSVQKFIFPSSEFFIGYKEEQKYILNEESGGILKIASSFLFHSMVMPKIQIVDKYNRPNWPIMFTQKSLPGSGSRWGLLSVITWGILLVFGLWKFIKYRTFIRIRIVIGLTIIFQFILHLIYGDETFLYSLHFLPLLVLLVSFATLTTARRFVLFFIFLLILFTGINNFIQFDKAIKFYQQHGNQRSQVKAQMRVRPDDLWPRGEGHVLLSLPGSEEENKAYHEPGGSFSPQVGSFGVSLWLKDHKNKKLITSDSIPLTDIKQKLFRQDGGLTPSITNTTSYYTFAWHQKAANAWKAEITPIKDQNYSYDLVIRSVGPAGGPIKSLKWNEKSLIINDLWTLQIEPLPSKVQLGDETKRNWFSEETNIKEWRDDKGWGYARLRLSNSLPTTAIVKNNTIIFKEEFTATQFSSALKVNVPDKNFISCLEAQIEHLVMGTVRGETRPGETMNYPLSWLRDGAYVLVALARAGLVDEVRKLSMYIAENDFFGGFGSEADGPGLALWALDEASTLINSKEFYQKLWPHVRRKANLILEMQSTKFPLYKSWSGPLVPALLQKIKSQRDGQYKEHGALWPALVAKPSNDDLIVGKMDNQFPLLHVNAVCYRGLISASNFADRNNHFEYSEDWQSVAASLKKAWYDNFKTQGSFNPRTYISGLWPTWIAASHEGIFSDGLMRRWKELRNDDGNFKKKPLWTYFDIAETHQWLYLNQIERVWKTLDWFWSNQASPGLFTWWEGRGEENTFHRWENVRGWIKPPHVTPHYWTAAEMLLLQLDMLSYVDESTEKPSLVIGAGIPKSWLNHNLSVAGFSSPIGRIDWYWNREELNITIHGKNADVRLGPSFPEGIPINVDYEGN